MINHHDARKSLIEKYKFPLSRTGVRFIGGRYIAMRRGCFRCPALACRLRHNSPRTRTPMHNQAVATIHHVQDYRRRKALRDCGQGSRRRQFLWLDPVSGQISLAVFRPATPSAASALSGARASGRRS